MTFSNVRFVLLVLLACVLGFPLCESHTAFSVYALCVVLVCVVRIVKTSPANSTRTVKPW